MRRRLLLEALAGLGIGCACGDALGASHRAVPLPADCREPLPLRACGADVIVRGERFALLRRTVQRLKRVQRIVGHGNFNLVSFDEALRYGRSYTRIGVFRRDELDFLEEMFFEDAARYGFYGAKVFTEITARVPRRATVKVPGSGHYLYRGTPLRLYEKLRADIGDSLVLTSGVRGLVKQMHLFLDKTVEEKGNLSLAARSLAPPGHSYHGVGDFDVGKPGFGLRNFSDDFAGTDEYRRLIDLGYVSIRYPNGNPFGVRFEPWHIKVI